MSSSAEAAIRTIISRYATAVTNRDTETWASTWAEAGVWELMGQAPEGRDAVVQTFETMMGGIPFVYQLAGEGDIELDASGERGTGCVPTVEFAKFGDGPGTLLLGTYRDVYVKEGGEWRFAERRMQVRYMGPPDLSGAAAG